jgi:hypothetical protein
VTVALRKELVIGNLRERLEVAAGRGDMRKIVDDLNRAYDGGKLGGRAVLLNFIKDLAHNLNCTGSTSRRWVR